MKCRYCGSDRRIHEIVLPAWGLICEVCIAEKDVQSAKESLMKAQVRYDENVERLDKLRTIDDAETAERATGGEDVRCQ